MCYKLTHFHPKISASYCDRETHFSDTARLCDGDASCVAKFSMHFNSDLDYLYSIYEDEDTFEGLSILNAQRLVLTPSS